MNVTEASYLGPSGHAQMGALVKASGASDWGTRFAGNGYWLLNSCGVGIWTFGFIENSLVTATVDEHAYNLFPPLLLSGRPLEGSISTQTNDSIRWKGDSAQVVTDVFLDPSDDGTASSWRVLSRNNRFSGWQTNGAVPSFEFIDQTFGATSITTNDCAAPVPATTGPWTREGVDAQLPDPLSARRAFVDAQSQPLAILVSYQMSNPDWYVGSARYLRMAEPFSHAWEFEVVSRGLTESVVVDCRIPTAGPRLCTDSSSTMQRPASDFKPGLEAAGLIELYDAGKAAFGEDACHAEFRANVPSDSPKPTLNINYFCGAMGGESHGFSIGPLEGRFRSANGLKAACSILALDQFCGAA